MILKSRTTIDAHIGGRIRDRRLLMGLSGRQLAEMIGVTTQQVHKYETGTDRISAGLIYVVAQALNTPISHFFEGLGGPQIPVGQRQRLLMEFTHSFREIQNEEHQNRYSPSGGSGRRDLDHLAPAPGIRGRVFDCVSSLRCVNSHPRSSMTSPGYRKQGLSVE